MYLSGLTGKKVRLWLFTTRAGDYPEGGTYDTSVFDSDAGSCSDPHQEVKFQDLLAYANGRGEVLQQVSSAEEAYAFCSPKTVAPPGVVPALTPSNAPQAGSTADIINAGWPRPTQQLTPTGAPTPSVVYLPGGGGYVESPAPAAPPAGETPAGPEWLVPAAGLAVVAFLFLRKKKG